MCGWEGVESDWMLTVGRSEGAGNEKIMYKNRYI